MGEVSDFFKAIGLFLAAACLFLSILVVFVLFVPPQCGTEVRGGEEAIGAMVYINDRRLGRMEKEQLHGYDGLETQARLCTKLTFQKGGLLRVEKEGFLPYTKTMEPSYGDSAPPFPTVWIWLVPIEKTKKLGDN